MKNSFSGVRVMQQSTANMLRLLHQEHIVRYIESRTPDEQLALIQQIEGLDLSVLHQDKQTAQRGVFAPLSAVTQREIRERGAEYTALGLQAIREGRLGAVLLAGGQGTRLGFDKPKGMFNIGVSRDLYIFECLIRNLMEVTDAAGAYVPLFVMTSVDNHRETRDFFAAHDYFGYSEDYVWFFSQEELPTLDFDDRLMLSQDGMICTAPNGNGGWYASMEKTGMLEILRSIGIEWLNVFAVDNVLQRIADPCFLGAVIAADMPCGAKVVAKADAEEKVGVLCLEDGRPSIVEYFEMTDEMRTARNADGTLAYRYGVILNYLFRTDGLDQTLQIDLPLHRAEKKIACMLPDGTCIQPEEPNAYKFETLALDMVRLQERCLAFEVERSREFAPVKNKEGVDSVDTARALLRRNGVIL